MTEVKKTKKTTAKPNKTEKSPKTEKPTKADKPDKADKADKNADSAADSTVEKTDTSTPNKSASQSSISHFSSVSTDEYRSGWANIFADGKTTKKAAKKTNGVNLPLDFELLDEDIRDDLRALLYKAFQRQARKEGVSLAQLKKSATIEYRLECDVNEK